jgi:hypothetical protein
LYPIRLPRVGNLPPHLQFWRVVGGGTSVMTTSGEMLIDGNCSDSSRAGGARRDDCPRELRWHHPHLSSFAAAAAAVAPPHGAHAPRDGEQGQKERYDDVQRHALQRANQCESGQQHKVYAQQRLCNRNGRHSHTSTHTQTHEAHAWARTTMYAEFGLSIDMAVSPPLHVLSVLLQTKKE